MIWGEERDRVGVYGCVCVCEYGLRLRLVALPNREKEREKEIEHKSDDAAKCVACLQAPAV